MDFLNTTSRRQNISVMLCGFLAIFIAYISSVHAFPYSFPDCVNGPLKNNTVCDTTKSPAERAQALVALFTVPELISNTVNQSPGVPRLGLPNYQWWSEALVCFMWYCGREPRLWPTIARRRIKPWRHFPEKRQFQLSYLFPTAHLHGSHVRRRLD